MAFAFLKRPFQLANCVPWSEVEAHYEACRHVALVRHGIVLDAKMNRRLYPAVAETEWTGVAAFDVMEDVRRHAPNGNLNDVNDKLRDVLRFVTLAAIGTDLDFDAALKADVLGLGESMKELRQGWQAARQQPEPRADPGENAAMLLARLNRVANSGEAYEKGRQALISGRFVDNVDQLFLLPYAVARRRGLKASAQITWRKAPRFDDLTAAEKHGIAHMFDTLVVGDDVIDLMVDVGDQLPHGDILQERIKAFHTAAKDLALARDVTADLPRGTPNDMIDLVHHPLMRRCVSSTVRLRFMPRA